MDVYDILVALAIGGLMIAGIILMRKIRILSAGRKAVLIVLMGVILLILAALATQVSIIVPIKMDVPVGLSQQTLKCAWEATMSEGCVRRVLIKEGIEDIDAETVLSSIRLYALDAKMGIVDASINRAHVWRWRRDEWYRIADALGRELEANAAKLSAGEVEGRKRSGTFLSSGTFLLTGALFI